MFRNGVILFCVFVVAVVGFEMDLNENYHLESHLSDTDKTIHFKVSVRTTGWVGFGVRLGAIPGLIDSDLIMGGINDDTQEPYFNDMFGDGRVNDTHPVNDDKVDWFLDLPEVPSIQNATHTILAFRRLLDTNDTAHDFEIKNEEINVIWSYGRSDDDQIIHVIRGSQWINLVTGVPRVELTESPGAASKTESILISTLGVFLLLLFNSL